MADERLRLIDLIDEMSTGRDVFFQCVRFAGDVMVEHVRALALSDTVQTCLAFMKNHKVRHAPVVDRPTGLEEKASLVGVVSERDLLRQISPYLGKLGEQDTDAKAQRQSLSQILTRKPKCVTPQTPLADVLAAMVENHVDMIPVLADGDLVGIVTAEDILKLFVTLDVMGRLCAQAEKTTRLVDVVSGAPGAGGDVFSSVFRTVEDIMTRQPVCLGPEDVLAKAMEVMVTVKCRHVPIVDAEARLVGIVSDRDVLRNLPFASGRRAAQGADFRGHLFAVDPNHKSLSLPLRRIMTAKVVHAAPGCTVYDAARRLHEVSVSCLPVVDETGTLQGIVTVMDLTRALLTAYRLIEKSRD